MATPRGLASLFSSLSISTPRCLRNTCSNPIQAARFSTSRIALGGPIARLRRERAHKKLRKAKERAIELKIQREARADPVIGHATPFTSSLLRHREILAKHGVASHTRAGEENWPILTNFGISSEDTLTLAKAVRDVEIKRLKILGTERKNYTTEQRFLYPEKDGWSKTQWQNALGALEGLDARKREVMARLVDLANANSRAVFDANLERAMMHFGRHEGDTGSPEVQGIPNDSKWKLIVAGVLTVKILALSEHMKRNSQDKQTKRALNMMVHQRQKMLKYLRRTKPERYFACLKDIGLDDSAVVREVR
jgi:ribosomal protein S15